MLTLLPTSFLPALVPKAPFLRPLMKLCHHRGSDCKEQECLCPTSSTPAFILPFLPKASEAAEPCGSSPNQKGLLSHAPVYLPQLHTSTEVILTARRVKIGFKGGLLDITDLSFCAGCNFPSSQWELCNPPATFPHTLSCIPLQQLFCFQRIAKTPKLDKTVLFSSELAHWVHPLRVLQLGPYLVCLPGSAAAASNQLGTLSHDDALCCTPKIGLNHIISHPVYPNQGNYL